MIYDIDCREIVRLKSLGRNAVEIGKWLGVDRRTVKKVYDAAVKNGLSWEDLDVISYKAHEQLFPLKTRTKRCVEPIIEEIRLNYRRGFKKSYIYKQYVERCAKLGRKDEAMSYSMFCRVVEKTIKDIDPEVAMTGEYLVVQWLPDPVNIYDEVLDKTEKAYIFLAVLAYSGCFYAAAVTDRNKETWVKLHSKAFEALGGLPRIILFPECSSSCLNGVPKAEYRMLSEYYGLVLEKNKRHKFDSVCEDAKLAIRKNLYKYEIGSLQELNIILRDATTTYMDTRESVGSRTRRELYYQDEKPVLRKLPDERFSIVIQKEAQVLYNCHISYEKHYYSVPWRIAKAKDHTVQVEITDRHVKIFYKDQLVADHPNLKDSFAGAYSTHMCDMPNEKEANTMFWNPKRYIDWAANIGPVCKHVIETELYSPRRMCPQQAYATCKGILELGRKYSREELEIACIRAGGLKEGSMYRRIKEILKFEHLNDEDESTYLE